MKKIFAANWKLQKTPAEAKAFMESFLKFTDDTYFRNREVFIFPQNFSLDTVLHTVERTPIQVGPQNIHTEKSGAFTGENSAQFSAQMGARLVLLGHSERRQYFHENSAHLAKKIKVCEEFDLLPVFCIGETLREREANETDKVCFAQVTEALENADRKKRIVIAYEPVWAIGTGKVATLDQVRDIHHKLSDKMNQLGFLNFQILYGGSVKTDNAKELIQIPHVDGFLIGGASLDPQSFHQICLSY